MYYFLSSQASILCLAKVSFKSFSHFMRMDIFRHNSTWENGESEAVMCFSLRVSSHVLAGSFFDTYDRFRTYGCWNFTPWHCTTDAHIIHHFNRYFLTFGQQILFQLAPRFYFWRHHHQASLQDQSRPACSVPPQNLQVALESAYASKALACIHTQTHTFRRRHHRCAKRKAIALRQSRPEKL